MRSEHALEELRRNLVVLSVGSVGLHGNGAGAELVDQGPQPLPGGLGTTSPFVRQAPRQQAANAQAHSQIGRQTALDQLDGTEQRKFRHVSSLGRGNHGTNALVLRW